MKKISMKTRNEVIEIQRAKYRLATKKEKTRILNTLCEATGLCRDQLIRRLNNPTKYQKKSARFKRGRKPTYDANTIRTLKYMWELANYPCGKRLAAAMNALLDALERHRSVDFDLAVTRNLRMMSASTIDRLLYSVKQQYQLKGKSTTKPGTLLKANIPIRLGTQWDDAKPGFFEIDLVAHCGEIAAGEYINTLASTDICTGWTETRAVVNKAQKHVFQALMDIKNSIPFPLLGIDSDNGSEFINDFLYRYCLAENICFTRSRPYKKNDNCHVEQKNWHIVRKNIGYSRYEGLETVFLMNVYYERLNLFYNYFLPQTKLISKQTIGSKSYKKYDVYLSPYQRAMSSSDISSTKKKELTKIFLTLDPVFLQNEMQRLLTRIQKTKVSTH